jgi:hypothetical protein
VLEADGPVAVRDSEGRLQGVVDRESVMDEVTRNASTVSKTREASRQAKEMEAA